MENLIIFQVKKLYKSNVSLRSTDVDKWIEDNSKVKVILNNYYMILGREELSNPVAESGIMESKFEGSYRLYDYKWKPEMNTVDNQIQSLVGEEWYNWIGEEFKRGYMSNLTRFLKERRKLSKVYPSPTNTFKAFKLTPYNNVKVVILGQDPYHNGTADGLAFSSGSPVRPKSLDVIFQEIKRTEKNNFNIRRDNSLEDWASQGVFLLNTVLTVEQGMPLSHEGRGWESFVNRVIISLNKHPNRLVFVLWGNKAKQYKKLIDNDYHYVLEGNHPAVQLHKGEGFIGNNHFEAINTFLVENYNNKIKW